MGRSEKKIELFLIWRRRLLSFKRRLRSGILELLESANHKTLPQAPSKIE